NAVLGMDEMILRETDEDQTYEYAESIRTAGNTLLSLVNDVLDYSKIEAGKMDIIPVEYELSSTLNDLVNMIRVRAENKGLSLSVNVSPTLPGHLYGDEIRIKQIVTNILTNAVKYTEKGGVTLSVDFTKTADDEIELRISVKDTGIGIRKEDIGKLFSEFERIEENRNRNIEGTGLGMSITTRLLHMMGSELHVDSVYGEGSDFYFSLKQKVVKWEPMGDYRETLRRSISLRTAYRESFTAPDALVLVVDDIPMNLKVFTGLLKKTKLQFDTAGSGLECLEKVTKQRYDIIFLDHQMPEPDGIETLHRMRALPQNINKDTPVIALTANAVSGAREEYIASGFDDYLTKPIDTVALEKMLIHYLPDEKVVLSSDAGGGEAVDGVAADGVATSDHGSFAGGESGGATDNGASAGEESGGITDEELSRIDGMDIPFARMHLPEPELLMTALSDFYQTVDIQADKLDELMNTLPESMDGYRIQVHGMKSSAAIIGLTGLSGMAKILEYAARDKDMQKISSLHPIFMIEWRKTKSDMRDVPGIAGDDDAPKLNYNAGEVRGLLSLLASSMEEFDLDRSDKIIEKLKEYDHPADVGEHMEKIYAAVADVDADKVKELVEAI
ncbi:MAG: response regulator, partial [Eubacterium sp.]|nr:response regulator [Eubacterium sp.]